MKSFSADGNHLVYDDYHPVDRFLNNGGKNFTLELIGVIEYYMIIVNSFKSYTPLKNDVQIVKELQK